MIFLSGRRSSALYFNNLDMRSRAPALTWAGKRKSTLKFSTIFQGIKEKFSKNEVMKLPANTTISDVCLLLFEWWLANKEFIAENA
jgi:hypothetical protein